MSKGLIFTPALTAAALLIYGVVGTSGKVDRIKALAPKVLSEKNLEIIRYEGYKLGSFNYHGGRVFYHVKDTSIDDTYYRVFLTEWRGEIHLYYGKPESLNRINLKVDEAVTYKEKN